MYSRNFFTRGATTFEVVAMLLGMVNLAIAAAYAVQLSKAPLDDHYGTGINGFHWSTAWAVFFYGTVPVVTVLTSIAGILLYRLGQAAALYGVVISTVFLTGWILTVALWSNCHYWTMEVGPSSFCYQKSLHSDGGYYTGVSNALANALIAFSVFAMLTYLSYTIYAAIAFHKQRKAGPEYPLASEMYPRKSAGSASDTCDR